MANDLSRINQQLIEIAKNAELAEKSFREFEARLKSILSAYAKGGVITEQGIASAIERILGGQFKPGMRVGGGAYLSKSSEFVSQVQKIIDDFYKSAMYESARGFKEAAGRFSLRFSKSETELLNVLERTFKAIDEIVSQKISSSGILQLPSRVGVTGLFGAPGATKFIASGLSPAEDYLYRAVMTGRFPALPQPGISGLLQPGATRQIPEVYSTRTLYPNLPPSYIPSGPTMYAGKAPGDIVIDLVARDIDRVQNEFILQADAFKRETEEILLSLSNQASERATLIASRIRQEDISDIELTVPEDVIRSVTGAERAKKIVESINSIAKLFGETPSAQKVRDELEKIIQVYQRFGKDITGVSLSSIDQARDGFKKLGFSLETTGEKAKKFNLFLSQTGDIFTEAEYKKRFQGRIPTLADVAAKGFDLSKVYELIEKQGFKASDLYKVRIEEPAGVARLIFRDKEVKEYTGAIRQLDVDVDKFGNTLTRTNRRVLSFTQAVTRNIGEVLRWSIGATLVYGAYYKLNELIKIAIDNQSKLADVTITLGSAQRTANEIFSDAAIIADETGESINAVLETYTMAYRAVGGIEDPIKRTASANKLLSDATILNKLSSLDAAESIDVLSGSLRQLRDVLEKTGKISHDTGSEFEYGTKLLDSWVKVSKIANIDLATLSTAFSITAESAINSGMSIDELNATIAILSEKIGGLGGRETGNAVRALIGGVYQEQAATALARYGIAVQNSYGQMRNFLDISRDIYTLYKQGVIDETQLNKLAYVLGGGVRRGQQYVAFLTDLDRLQTIATKSASAQGDASAALGIKLETLQTAATRLGNSIQNLAQSMGDEGGLLGTFTELIYVGKFLIDIISKITDLLGSVTVPATLLTFLGLYAQLGGKPAVSKLEDISGRIAGPFSGFGVNAALAIGNILKANENQMARLATSISYGIPSSLLIGAIPTISKIGEKDYKGAAITAAGSIVGGIVGGLTGPQGAVIGSVIGTTIADIFVTRVLNRKDKFENLFVDIWRNVPRREETRTAADEYITKRERAARYLQEVTPTAPIGHMVYNFLGSIGRLFGAEIPELTQEQYAAIMLYQSSFGPFGRGIPTGLQKKQKERYEEWLRLAREAEDITPDVIKETETSFYKLQEELAKRFDISNFSDALSEVMRKQLFSQLSAKQITNKEYSQAIQQTLGVSSILTRLLTALDITDVVEPSIDAVKELGNTLVYASKEDIDVVSSLITEIEDLNTQIKDSDDSMIQFGNTMITEAEAVEILRQKGEDLKLVLESINKTNLEQQLSRVRLFDVFSGAKGYDLGQYEKILSRAKKLQEEFLQAQLDAGAFIDEAQMQNYIDAARPILIYLGQSMGYMLAEGITDSNFLQQAIDELTRELELPELQNLGYQFMNDVTLAQFNSIMNQYNAIRQSILAAGGTSEETPLLTFFKDTTSPIYMQKDWRIVQYLLQEILKVNEKQLDGIYNLPSGASFYVPFQAWAMDRETRQAMAEPTQYDFSQWDQAAYEQYTAGVQLETASSNFLDAVNYWKSLLDQGLINISDVPEDIRKYLEYKYGEELPIGRPYTPSGDLYDVVPYMTYEEWLKSKGITQPPTALSAIDTFVQQQQDLIDQISGLAGIAPGAALAAEKKYGEQPQVQDFPTPAEAAAGAEYLGQPNIMEVLNNILSTLRQGFGLEGGGVPETNVEQNSLFDLFNQFINGILGNLNIDFSGTTVPQTEIPQIQTNLNIDLQSQTQLIVDGRVLADVIKPYLYQDMVSYENTAGTTGSAYVAA